jgi:hypothetical protein
VLSTLTYIEKGNDMHLSKIISNRDRKIRNKKRRENRLIDKIIGLKGNFVVSIMEWGEDYPPMDWNQVEKKRDDVWDLPSLDNFDDARSTKVKGFEEPQNKYWVDLGQGDVGAVRPAGPIEYENSNSYTVKRRLRLVRRVSIHAITS